MEIPPERLFCGVCFYCWEFAFPHLTAFDRERSESPPAGLEVGSDQLKFIKRTSINVNTKQNLKNIVN